jgi:hypothetical protein
MSTEQKEQEENWRCRRICITLWVVYGFHTELPQELIKKYKIRHYHIGSEEQTKSGYYHHHAVMYSDRQLTRDQVKMIVGQKEAHVEPMVSKKYKNAVDYADKNKDWQSRNPGEPTTKTNGHDPVYIYGHPPRQGATRHSYIRDHFKDGGTMKQLMKDDVILPTLSRCMKFASACKLHFTPDRKEQTRLIWIWGPPRTGKSYTAEKMARHLVGDNFHCQCNAMGEWWDGYEQQKVTIIEEFRGQIALSRFLSLFDWTPKIKVPVKGHSEKFTSEWIIVTSNLSWEETWNQAAKNYDVNIAAFEKRLKQFGRVVKLTKVYNSPKHVIKMKKVQREITDLIEACVDRSGEGTVLPLSTSEHSTSEH